MKSANLNFQRIEKREGNKPALKRWASLNSNGNDSDNAHNFSVVKMHQIGKGVSFSVGDCWPAVIDGIVSFYKVLSVEDIIIPAGRYKCFNLCEEMKDGKKNYYWFAPDIGLVKFDIDGIKGALQGFSYDKAL